ncbi:MAG: hypothetical protein CVV05_14665 [Gammaproteobacteria bacterium HGW-Gammaproteobacteria-1]|jgi:hypothetical protein|nr:MAG: hypothetical protein CVV05_14665 [Gammaproteobacteria bacterium HGW-Gammaproteobacteria-1]
MMKYLVAISLGALIVGGALTAVIHYLFGTNPGYFFAKFVAAPVGLVVSVVGFLVYDTLWPRRKTQERSGRKDE